MKIQDCLYKNVCTNECSPNCIRYIQFNRLLELSNLPKNFQEPIKLCRIEEDVDAYNKLHNIKLNINDFVKDGKNLYICSNTCGNGKTSWAVKLMLKYFDLTWPNSYDVTRGLFVHVPTLFIDLKKFGNIPEYVNRIKDADLVIWDDLAFGNMTEYEHEQLLQFIDYRINDCKSNIFTSNITNYDTLIKSIGNRLASRIYNGSEIIQFNGKDFRVGGKL